MCVCIYIYIYIHNLDCALAQGCHFGANGDWLAVVCQYLLHILWFQNSIKYPRLLAWVYMLKNTHWLILWPQTTPPPTSYQYRKSFWEFISPQIYAIMCGDHKQFISMALPRLIVGLRRWDLNSNTMIFSQENPFINVVWKSGGLFVMALIC